ncbi:MAG: SDR family oxidoreductase [Bacteroidales bacterium]|nr:SDR family oxidoreductase [Bacteroidales bacterium]
MDPQYNPFSLKDKLIVVTGASSGIGRQCAVVCSHVGARVVLFGRDQERLGVTLRMMKEPERHIKYAVDLVDFRKVEEIVSELVRLMGQIDGLINCAGISTTLPFNSSTPEKMELFFKTNVIGPMNLTRQVVKPLHFSKTGGSVVFISSVMGVVGESGKVLYSLTKGALVASAKSLAVELSARNIRVNTISPGVVESPMSQQAVYSKDQESLNRIKGLHLLGLGKSEDIAHACVYILSDSGKWITGTNLIVDGGYLAR